ncbi:hypothetical protein AMS59_04280 [Lysinibacillus sp. FJAT-14745]|uniref:hypothetical protein n=1 Tax=Lysinibacillus sp. FJAT-14745 TaxID=1704289 RepID=UPI0006ABCE7B|nr:hypothetical protein [Lysinibacillus sp. FJAT-14745]KOP80600.1 hypothetical protein AMS59_04280 [Lysinibacillus sp. FJAT-14745]
MWACSCISRNPELYVGLAVGPNTDMESYVLRSILEYFGARDTVHLIDWFVKRLMEIRQQEKYSLFIVLT